MTDFDEALPYGVLSLGILVLIFSSFYVGRRYERRYWERITPPAMELTCNECYDVGLHKGLKTCDDMIDNANTQGPR